MRDWFIQLRDELMPEPVRRLDQVEEAEAFKTRYRRLELARWELLKEGHGREPSTAAIYERAWGNDGE